MLECAKSLLFRLQIARPRRSCPQSFSSSATTWLKVRDTTFIALFNWNYCCNESLGFWHDRAPLCSMRVCRIDIQDSGLRLSAICTQWHWNFGHNANRKYNFLSFAFSFTGYNFLNINQLGQCHLSERTRGAGRKLRSAVATRQQKIDHVHQQTHARHPKSAGNATDVRIGAWFVRQAGRGQTKDLLTMLPQCSELFLITHQRVVHKNVPVQLTGHEYTNCLRSTYYVCHYDVLTLWRYCLPYSMNVHRRKQLSLLFVARFC